MWRGARWPHCAERVLGLTRVDRIDRSDQGTGGTQRRLTRTLRDDRVGVEPRISPSWYCVEHALHVVVVVDRAQGISIRERGYTPLKRAESRPIKRRVDGAQAFGALRMAATRVVAEARLVRVVKSRHLASVILCAGSAGTFPRFCWKYYSLPEPCPASGN